MPATCQPSRWPMTQKGKRRTFAQNPNPNDARRKRTVGTRSVRLSVRAVTHRTDTNGKKANNQTTKQSNSPQPNPNEKHKANDFRHNFRDERFSPSNNNNSKPNDAVCQQEAKGIQRRFKHDDQRSSRFRPQGKACQRGHAHGRWSRTMPQLQRLPPRKALDRILQGRDHLRIDPPILQRRIPWVAHR